MEMKCETYTLYRDEKPWAYVYGYPFVADMMWYDMWPKFKTEQEAIDYWNMYVEKFPDRIKQWSEEWF